MFWNPLEQVTGLFRNSASLDVKVNFQICIYILKGKVCSKTAFALAVHLFVRWIPTHTEKHLPIYYRNVWPFSSISYKSYHSYIVSIFFTPAPTIVLLQLSKYEVPHRYQISNFPSDLSIRSSAPRIWLQLWQGSRLQLSLLSLGFDHSCCGSWSIDLGSLY